MGRGAADLLYLSAVVQLLGCSGRAGGLADFSNYLSRILSSHSASACDGQPVRLHCPRHSTVSIQNAFYGAVAAQRCPPEPSAADPSRHRSCSSSAVLQKLLSECQDRRDCLLHINPPLFGPDPCPGTAKYLHVDYKCKPTEHKSRAACEGETLVLRCKPPRVLFIYSAFYGRAPGRTEACPTRPSRWTPFGCENSYAVLVLNERCYGRQRCAIAVGNRTLKDPCLPGTRKYLSVIFTCVPWILLKEVDPNVYITTSSPMSSTQGLPLDAAHRKGSNTSAAMMSSSLLTYAFIKEHPDMAALLFTSSVCAGLLVTLLAVSAGAARRRRRLAEDEDKDEEDDDDDEDDRDTRGSWRMSTWEDDATYASERAARMERREMIIQEIWMNACRNGGHLG
ncbi:protein eva-1 homolog C [Festucalex cinctus]